MKKKISYSIIIPHKNTPKLLQRCLNSIPRRNDVQIIVVDDNSTSSICDFNNYPGKEDPYVKLVFSKKGLGAGYARNVGLKYALGKWLLFVDCDDILYPKTLDILDKYQESDYDIIYFLVDSFDSYTLKPAKRHLSKENWVKRFDKNIYQMDQWLRFGYTEPWGKLINHDLVKKYNIKFDESLVANDYMFSVLTGYYAKSIKLSKDRYYCVSVRDSSISYNFFGSSEKALSRLSVYEKVQIFYQEHGISLRPFYQLICKSYMSDSSIFKLYMNECRKRYFIPCLLLKCLFFGGIFKFKQIVLNRYI